MWGLSALLNPTFFSWSLDPEVRVQGAVCSWVANVWADGGERAEGSRRRKEGGSSLGQGKAAATFWESSFKTAFLFTNFYFGTSDKAAGKFLTPLFPGSEHCQLLPLPRAAFLTNPDGFCKQLWLCALCPEAQAARPVQHSTHGSRTRRCVLHPLQSCQHFSLACPCLVAQGSATREEGVTKKATFWSCHQGNSKALLKSMAPGALLSVSKLFLNSYFALLTLISASLLLGWGALRLQTSTSRRAAMEPAGT